MRAPSSRATGASFPSRRGQRRADDRLLPLADEFGSQITRLYVLLRQPLFGGEVSLPRGRVLSVLHNEGPRRIQELAWSEQVSQPTMTRMVAAMEQRGWVRRAPDATDGRAVLIELTDAGRTALLAVRASRARHFADRLRELPPDQLEQLDSVLEPIGHLIAFLEERAAVDRTGRPKRRDQIPDPADG